MPTFAVDASPFMPLIGPLAGTVVGGAISTIVSIATVRVTLRNQLALEDRRFQYQRQLEQEKRDHEASAYRRVVRRSITILDNTSAMRPKRRTALTSWEERAADLGSVLSDPEAFRALSDDQYDAAWRVKGEAEFAIWSLRLWASWLDNNSGGTFNMDAVLGALNEYALALQNAHRLFNQDERVEKWGKLRDTQFKGCGFWITNDFSKPELYPNP